MCCVLRGGGVSHPISNLLEPRGKIILTPPPPLNLSENTARPVEHCMRPTWLTIVGGYIRGNDRRVRRKVIS
jgi:hypothetical protein